MAERGSDFASLSLTARQRREVREHWRGLQREGGWHGELPVLLLDRCWLRLSCLPVRELILRLPPDASREAPELVHYRALMAAGHPSWQAQQLCWQQFGIEACQQAQLRFWTMQEEADVLWRLEDYLSLIRQYRHRFRVRRPRPLPLLLLPRSRRPPGSGADALEVHWLGPECEPP